MLFRSLSANVAKWMASKRFARMKAMGPAIIDRPLRKIAEHTAEKYKDAKGNVIFRESEIFKDAWQSAKHGDGLYVKQIAREVLA